MGLWVDAYGWPVPPTVLLGCIIAESLYFRGWLVLLRQVQATELAQVTPPTSGFLSSGEDQRKTWIWRGTFFLAAMIIVLIGSSAPVDKLSSQLFWVHMVQHLLLLIIMAPLLVAGSPLLPLWYGLPGWLREWFLAVATLKISSTFYSIGRWVRQPAITCVLLIVGTWIWHWPPLYDLALTNELVHDWCEHLTFLAVSLLFWSQILPSVPLNSRLGYLGKMGLLGIGILQNLVLAVLLGFSQMPLYAPYAHLGIMLGGLSPLQDQQIGASIMWTVGDLPFGIAISILMQKWLAIQLDDKAEDTRIALNSNFTTER